MDYLQAVELAGGAPLLLPNSRLLDGIAPAVAAADALLLTGGWDVAAELYGQQQHPSMTKVDPVRDAVEQEAIREAMRLTRPILGICRGIQILNVALGGTLIRDIPSERDGAVVHREGEHPVRVEAGSILAKITDWRARGSVNSTHHQAVDRLAEGLKPTALSPDGIVEAVETADAYPLLAVQWHPERLAGERKDMLAPFTWLVSTATKSRRS